MCLCLTANNPLLRFPEKKKKTIIAYKVYQATAFADKRVHLSSIYFAGHKSSRLNFTPGLQVISDRKSPALLHGEKVDGLVHKGIHVVYNQDGTGIPHRAKELARQHNGVIVKVECHKDHFVARQGYVGTYDAVFSQVKLLEIVYRPKQK